MKTQNGFTLIELMIAVVIVGILAAIAVPSYQNYVVKSNRAAAQAFMVDAACWCAFKITQPCALNFTQAL